MDIFDRKDAKPMLIAAEEQKPFNDINYVYELKLDGVRCIAYLDKDAGTELRNKRNIRITPKYPELNSIHEQINKRCILDGELIVFNNGRPEFSEIQRRAIMSNKIKIELAAKKYPVTLVVFDIIYCDDKQVTDLPLIERKKLLDEAVNENDRISISRYIEEKGIELYELTAKNDLEGIVAKRKDGKYFLGKNTKEWVKIKNLKDDDFVVCGYTEKEKGTASLLLGQYNSKNILAYKGHVSISMNKEEFKTIMGTQRIDSPVLENLNINEVAIWLEPINVCVVKYLETTSSGSLRHPSFKGLRNDKEPYECKETTS